MNQLLRAFGLIVLPLGCFSLLTSPVSAQSFFLPTITNQLTKQTTALPLEFNNNSSTDGFDGQGRPRSRTSGGSRGGCSDLLVALVPGSGTVAANSTTVCNAASTSDLATTLESSPTLWFYIPTQTQSAVSAEFVLLDNNDRVLSSEMITLPDDGGVISLQLSHSLETDQVYHWIFSILNSSSPSENPTVEGSLQRIEAQPELSGALAAAPDALSRIRALSQYGVWHDTLHGLALLYQTDPNNSNLQNNWVTLLGSVGLEEIAKAAPVNCCVN